MDFSSSMFALMDKGQDRFQGDRALSLKSSAKSSDAPSLIFIV